MIAGLFQRLFHDVASYPSNPELRWVEAISARYARFMASLIAR
jgi:hypothetical protein